jgi:hypothetical protein
MSPTASLRYSTLKPEEIKMLNRIRARKWIFLSLVVFAAASIITAGVFSSRKQRQSQTKQREVVALPSVVSHVPKLKVVNIDVKNSGSSNATAVVEILNASALPVMYVEISTKNSAGDSGAVGDDGLFDPDNPRVVIPPYGTTKVEISFSEMVPDAPLVVSAAVFADGSEEGDQWARDAARRVRAHQQERIRQDKQRRERGGLMQ